MATTEIYAPQKRYVQRQKAEGFIAVTVWVPEQDRERAIKYAAGLRKEHIRLSKMD